MSDYPWHVAAFIVVVIVLCAAVAKSLDDWDRHNRTVRNRREDWR